MIGLLILLGTALVLLIALLSAMLAREMRRPPRHTTAYALAKGLPCDPGDLNLAYEEWWLDRPDGARLPVWDIALTNPKWKGENRKSLTAVFVHGWGHSRVDVLPRVPTFVPYCDRIILYDLRGHGETPGRSNLGHREGDDLLALLEHLGDERLLLIGHSMGAVIAINAAIKANRQQLSINSRIAGIIAYGAYCEFHESLRGRLRVAGYPGRPITDLALLLHRLNGIVPLSLRESDMQQLRCPILLIHGCEDRVAPLAHGRRIGAALDIEVYEVAGAAHTDAHTIDADHHDAIVREFMQRISPGPTALTSPLPLNAPPPPG